MMKRALLLIGLLLFFGKASLAQQASVVVTGTAVDANSRPYANGTGRVTLVPTNTSWTIAGSPVSQTVWTITLNTSGVFSVQLPPTTAYAQQNLNPSYTFAICGSTFPVPPYSTSQSCFSVTGIKPTTTTDITTQINAAIIALPQIPGSNVNGGGSGPGTVTSVSGANGVSVGSPTSTPVVGLGNISPTTIDVSQDGNFTSGSQQEYSESLLNSCNPGTEYFANHGNQSTEAIAGCVASPGGATQQANAVAGYCTTLTNTCAGGYFQTRNLANNTFADGVNGVVQDFAGLTAGVTMLGFDSNVVPLNGASTYTAIEGFNAALTASNAGVFGFAFDSTLLNSTGTWTASFESASGAAPNALDVNASTTGTTSVPSQNIRFGYYDSGSTHHFNSLYADATGTLNYPGNVSAAVEDKGGQVYNVKAYGATGNNSTNDATAIGSAITACSSTGGIIFFPAATYKISSSLTAASGCSFVGAPPQVQAVSNTSPDSDVVPTGGSWLNCGAANCITGSSLRNTNIRDLGLENWTGQALLFGSNNGDGISFSDFNDLIFVGSSTVNGSDTSIELINAQHVNMDGIYSYKVNTNINWINQSEYFSGGNSVLSEIYAYTYPKSAANSNNTKPGIWFQVLAPSAGTALGLNYITCIRCQVNSFSGDGTGNMIQLAGYSTGSVDVDGVNFISTDIEGTFNHGFDASYTTEARLQVTSLDQATGGADTFYMGAGATNDTTEATSFHATYASAGANNESQNVHNGELVTCSTAYGVYGCADGVSGYSGVGGLFGTTVTLQAPFPATNGSSPSAAPPIQWTGNYYNGSASVNVTDACTFALATGTTTPAGTMTCGSSYGGTLYWVFPSTIVQAGSFGFPDNQAQITQYNQTMYESYGLMWTSGSSIYSGVDTDLCRAGVGTLEVGTGTSCGNTGNLQLGSLSTSLMNNETASTVASGTTIAPTTPMVITSGTTSIATITLPSGFTTGCFDLIPSGTQATTTAGNIAAVYTLTSGTLYRACYNGTKWYIK